MLTLKPALSLSDGTAKYVGVKSVCVQGLALFTIRRSEIEPHHRGKGRLLRLGFQNILCRQTAQ
jgi:hypothetical protein